VNTATEKKKPLTKKEIKSRLAEKTGLENSQVENILDELNLLIIEELRDHGEFNLPALLKIKKIVKPAVKGGVEKPNPFKPGETMITKDKPEKKLLKITVLKALKDGIQQ
jgi:nucleoid DNA-binding protein